MAEEGTFPANAYRSDYRQSFCCMHHRKTLKWAQLLALTTTLTFAGFPANAQTFGVYRQLWTGLSTSDGSVNALTNTLLNPNWPNTPNPAYTQVFTSFETETNLLDGYGQRLRAFVVSPATGYYVFWIASGDNSSLSLSADESTTNKVVCSVSSSTTVRQWTKEPNQMSAPMLLEAGRRYYLEALHKAAAGNDNLAVRWRLPSGAIEEPLAAQSGAGTLLIPYNGVNTLPGIFAQPSDTTVPEGANATFSLLVTNWGPVTYQWRTNGVNLLGSFSRKSFLTVSNVSIAVNNGEVLSCLVSNPSGSVTSVLATLTVVTDTIAPTLSSANSVGQTTVAVGFSKPVEAVSATNSSNYALSGGLAITGASLVDAQTVWLTVSPVSYGSNYVLTVNNVRDRASTPNTIAANSQISFTAAAYNPALVGGASPGTLTILTNGYDITGAGNDIGGISDQFQFDYQLLSGDFDMRVRLQGLDRIDVWTKAGLVARETLATNSRFAGAIATPMTLGSFFESRANPGGPTTNAGNFPPNYPFTWLRLQRAGSQFTGYASYDGQTWSILGTATLTFSNTLYFGMAVASHINGEVALAQFRDLGPTPNSATIGTVINPNETLATSSRKTALVISEIMYKPAPRTDGKSLEFVEIYNANPYFFDMSGWQLAGGSISFTFPTPMIIPGGGFVVIGAVPADLQSIYGVKGVLGPYTGNLKKSGLIQLVDEVGAVRLEIPYSNLNPWPVAADGTGHSLVLARPSYGEGDPHAWDISDVVGGSPGTFEAYRPSPLRNVVINEMLINQGGAPYLDYIELYNHSSQTADISGCVLTDNPSTNKFIIPPGTVLGAGGFAVFYQSSFGFALNAAGDAVFLKNPDGSRVLDAVQYEAQAEGVSLGRSPDGASEFYPMKGLTPGGPNSDVLIQDIVINELMYKPISGNDDDQFIELYNKGTNTVNLGGWEFTSGIAFAFPSNTTIMPGGYLVVARNAANLFTKYPNLNSANTLGDYSGKLSHNGGRVALAMPQAFTHTNNLGQLVTNILQVVQDEVTYLTGGRWGKWSSGGGSSLELIDPRSNHRLAANWADSDETAKAPWVNIEHTGVLDDGAGSAGFVQIGLLDSGECMVDAVEVRMGPNGTNLVLNSDFENGLANWFIEGCFVTSTRETNNAGFYSSSALHLRCTDRMWTGGNSAEGKLGSPSPVAGQTATLRFKARWLHGWPEALLRFDGNYLEATGPLAVPDDLGTPGQPNSRAVMNSAPAIYEVTHTPAVPAANQPVTVTARVHDPDGVQSLTLLYRIDPSFNYTAVAMNDMGLTGDAIAGDGLFSAIIPGLAAGAPGASASRVEFYLAAKDSLGASNTFPAVVNEVGSIHECVVMFGDILPTSSFSTYHIWISATNATRWANMPNLGNEGNDATFVYGNRVIYNTLGRFSGSPYHQQFTTPYGAPCHYKWVFPEDDKLFGATSFNKLHAPGNGAGDDQSIQREQLAHTFGRALGIPWLNRKYFNMFVNGVRRGTLMEDTQTPDGDVVKQYWPNDSGGFLYKMQPWFEFNQPAGNNAGDIGNNNESWCNVMSRGVGVPNYLTTGGVKKLARYRWNYLMRRTPDSASNYTNVFSFVDAANSFGTPNYTAIMTNFADMENFMRVGAENHAAGNWDSYMCQNAQNLYGYIGTKGTRYSLLMWDFNIVIGNSGSWNPGENLFSGNGQDPNTGNFYNNPPFRRAYWRALQELVNGPLEVTKSGPLLDAKFASFRANGFNSVEDPNVGIKAWLAAAQASIARQLAAENAASFKVLTTNVNVTSNSVTLRGSAPVQVMSLTINGETWPVNWTSGSGSFGPTNWSITLPISPGNNQLIVRGYDRFGHFISGTSNNITVVSTPPPPDNPVGNVVITEIMFNPLVTDAQFVELYNVSSTTTFDLSGWVFDGLGYTFPPGSSIAPGAFLVLAQNRAAFAAAYGATNLVFDSFPGPLQPDVQTLTLVEPGPPQIVIDQVRYQGAAPWPTGSNGVATASSVQVIDPLQDNSRAGNWVTTYIPAIVSPGTNLPVIVHPPVVHAPVTNNAGWHFVSVTGTSDGTNALLISLNSAGNVYIDDFALVDGTSPGVGFNFVSQGDFESPALDTNIWMLGTNYLNTAISSDVAHSGSHSLHMVSTAPGNSFVPLRGIEQILSTAPTNGEVCTLSFWYYATSSASNFFVRLSPNLRIQTNVDLNITPGYTTPGYTDGGYYVPPQVISPALVVATPDGANSASVVLPPFPPLWINEAQADNLTGITNSAGQHVPWIELYNAGATNVPLSGLYLANNYTNLTQWAFPGGASINPGEFKIIFCDGQTGLSTLAELHTSFTLTSGSGSIALTRLFQGAPQVVDFLDYSNLPLDRSYGDFPDGQPFTRQQFFAVTPGAPNKNTHPALQVFVNEWMSGNTRTITDPADGLFDDWFELYNASTTSADLSGYFLANNITNKFQFQIPVGYIVPAHGFLLVWADKEAKQNSSSSPDLHTNFRLPKGGAEIGLYASDGSTVDLISYHSQPNDLATGRCPDGGSQIHDFATATPRGPNQCGNSPPILQSIPDRTVVLGQTLSFTASATDLDPGQTLVFSLFPGAPSGAGIDSASGLFHWTPTPAQAPSTSTLAVSVADNGSPSMNDSKSFTVMVALPPRATVTRNMNTISLSFPTFSGKSYQIQYKDNLGAPAWTALAPAFTAGPGSTTTKLDDMTGHLQRFYRIVVVN